MSPIELRSPRTSGIFALALALALSGCASGSGGAGAGGGSADMITEQQIDDAGVDTTWDVIRRYRPRWLRPARSQSSIGASAVTSRPGMPQKDGDAVANEVYPKVVLDGVPYGEIDSLSSIDSRSVSSIRFVSATDATTLYGTGYVGGVIEVRTRSGR